MTDQPGSEATTDENVIAELRKQLAAANQGNAEMRKELDALRADRTAEREEMLSRLETKGENERLVEELKADNAKLRMSADRAKALDKILVEQVTATIKDIPEEYHEDIASVPLERRLAFAEKLRASLAPPKAPDLGGAETGARVKAEEPIELNDDEKLAMSIFGFGDAKEYQAAMNAASTGIVERAAARAETQAQGGDNAVPAEFAGA